MAIQDRPLCFGCSQVVEYDPLYEAPCGHDDCPSAVFHGLCLMDWRERRDEAIRRWIERHKQWMEQHQQRHDHPKDT